jgi:hypothetical protein
MKPRIFKLSNPNKRVHCHICPLKEFCEYAESEGSFLKSRVDLWDNKWEHFDTERSVGIPPRPRDPDKEQETRIGIATANCPLRKIWGAS